MSDIPKARAILRSLIDSPVKLKRKEIKEKIKEAISHLARAPMSRPRAAISPKLSNATAKSVYAYVKANPNESFDSVAGKFGTTRARVTKAWDDGQDGKL